MLMEEKMKGTVKFFNSMKGFGFIAGEDGKEYFVPQTGLKEGISETVDYYRASMVV